MIIFAVVIFIIVIFVICCGCYFAVIIVVVLVVVIVVVFVVFSFFILITAIQVFFSNDFNFIHINYFLSKLLFSMVFFSTLCFTPSPSKTNNLIL